MKQPDLFGPRTVVSVLESPVLTRFDGADYVPVLDDQRLGAQLARIYAVMQDGTWRTLTEIAALTHDPPASISAQLRHLRKPKFGSYTVQRRTRAAVRGLYEYRLDTQRD